MLCKSPAQEKCVSGGKSGEITLWSSKASSLLYRDFSGSLFFDTSTE